MFFADPRGVFATLHAAVRPVARLVFSCFRAATLNPWAGALAQAIGAVPVQPPKGYGPGPFGIADAPWVIAMLAAAGWRAIAATSVDYAYVAGEGSDAVGDAAAFFSRIGPVASALAGAADDDARRSMRTRLVRELEHHRTGDRVAFPAAAWLWTATA